MTNYWIHNQIVQGVDYPQSGYVAPIIQEPIPIVVPPIETQEKPVVAQKRAKEKPIENHMLRDLTSALVNMGWKRMDAKATAEETIAEEPPGSSIEQLIRAVLRKVKR